MKNSDKFKLNERYLIFLIQRKIPLILFFGVLLIFLRQVDYFIDPRFWAEEATIYFKNAYDTKSLKNFFTPQLGYYSLYNQIAAYIALLVPLKYAPFVTTTISVVPIYLVFYLSIVTRNSYLRTFEQRVIFATLMILISSGEIWLNTITSQFWFALCVLLIIIDRRPHSIQIKIFYAAVVFMASLTGVIALFLIPLAIALIIFFKENHKNVKFILDFLIAGLVVQVILILIFGFNFGVNDLSQIQGGARFDSFNMLEMIKSFIGYYFLYPFTGVALYDYSIVIYGLYGSVLILTTSYLIFINFNKKIGLILAYCINFSLLTMVLSVGGNGGLRYAFLVNALFLIIFISFLNCKNKVQLNVVRVILALTILTGIVEYKIKLNNFSNVKWLSWQEQFSPHEKRSNKLIVWPQSPHIWSVYLKK
mgnify:CR=1 FL=1|jgi:hypothetical protein